MKKLITITVFLLAVIFESEAQTTLNFSNLSGMEVPKGAIESATDGSYLYVVNGFSPFKLFTSQALKYDIVNDYWSEITNRLIPKQFPSCEVIGENLYVFNGTTSSGGYNKKMEIVNLKDGSVTLSTDNPVPARLSGSSVWKGNIYVFGGKVDSVSYSNKLYKYDPLIQKWTELANMPEAKQTKGEIIDGKLYVLGGYNGTPLDGIDRYDIQKNEWTRMIKIPKPLSANSVTFSGSKIYTVFDFADQINIGDYDILTNKFEVLKQIGMIGRRHAGAQIVKGKLYIMGGNTSSLMNSALYSLQVANIKK
jgi:N-acetylneuraminic acid mutarotase